MAAESVKVVARVRARPECVVELEKVLRALLVPTRNEAGNLRYQLLHSLEDECDFTFIEEWQDDAALDTHMATPHVQQAFAATQNLLACAPEIRRYREL